VRAVAATLLAAVVGFAAIAHSHVRLTDRHDGPWTKVYVPNAKRWGWVENIHL